MTLRSNGALIPQRLTRKYLECLNVERNLYIGITISGKITERGALGDNTIDDV